MCVGWEVRWGEFWRGWNARGWMVDSDAVMESGVCRCVGRGLFLPWLEDLRGVG